MGYDMNHNNFVVNIVKANYTVEAMNDYYHPYVPEKEQEYFDDDV